VVCGDHGSLAIQIHHRWWHSYHTDVEHEVVFEGCHNPIQEPLKQQPNLVAAVLPGPCLLRKGVGEFVPLAGILAKH